MSCLMEKIFLWINSVDTRLFSALISIIGVLVSGIISFGIACFVYGTENKKNVIKQRHEIALNQLIPKVYNPILNILHNYQYKKSTGVTTQLDYQNLRRILSDNRCLMLFIPSDMALILDKIYNELLDLTIIDCQKDEKVYKLLVEFQIKLKNALKSYILKG